MAANPALALVLCFIRHVKFLLGRLAGFTNDAFAHVLDALALVRLGLLERTNIGGHLANHLLVDPDHRNLRLLRYIELHAIGRFELDRMAKAKLKLQLVLALGLSTLTNANDFELLAVALVDANDHIAHQ